MKYKQKLVGLRPEQLKRLSAFAKASGIPVNQVVRTAVDHYFATLGDRK